RRQQPLDHGHAYQRPLAQRARLAGDGRHVPRRHRLLRHVTVSAPERATTPDDRSALIVIGVVSLVVVLAVAYLLLGHRAAPGARPFVAALPLLNACLNATSAALLTAGWLFIRGKHVTAHKTCMVSALAVSILFLVSYVTYHSLAGSRPFG